MAATAQFVQITLDSETIGGAWKLYHYEPGTETLKDVWTDRAKGATGAQPLVADANGVVSFYADGLYDLVVKNSADVLKYTWEDVFIAEIESIGEEGSTLPSANTLVLGTLSEIYNHVSGTTAILALSGTQPFVILTFDASLLLTDGSSFRLRNRANRQTRIDETAMFVNDGAGIWREVAPVLRLGNSQFLTGRNAANSAEINMMQVDAADKLQFGTDIVDESMTLCDGADTTKRASFDASGISTATTRTYTLPNASGTIALTSDLVPSASTTVAGKIELATQAEVNAGTPVRALTTDLNLVSTLATQSTSSGTAFDFTVPAGVKRVAVVLKGVSLSGTDNLLVQLGDAGGVEVTGYISTSAAIAAAGTTVVASTAGFIIKSGVAANVISGIVELILHGDANQEWVSSHSLKNSATVLSMGGGQHTTLSNPGLTTVRLTRDGTDTFDAGEVSVLYQR